MSISILMVYKFIIYEEVQMTTQTKLAMVQWQDFKVVSEADLVLEIAQKEGWKDCKTFGHGEMITQPLQSLGWKLIPADLYEYSIPAKGVNRLLKIINAGVHIQGVIIADDMRRVKRPPTPTRPVAALPSAHTVLSTIGTVLLGLVALAGIIVIGLAIAKTFFILLPLLFIGDILVFDPQLIILVDDGQGGMAWISVLTWYD